MLPTNQEMNKTILGEGFCGVLGGRGLGGMVRLWSIEFLRKMWPLSQEGVRGDTCRDTFNQLRLTSINLINLNSTFQSILFPNDINPSDQ